MSDTPTPDEVAKALATVRDLRERAPSLSSYTSDERALWIALSTAERERDEARAERLSVGRAWLLTLSPETLLETLSWLDDRRCTGCGYPQPEGKRCQCQNDE